MKSQEHMEKKALEFKCSTLRQDWERTESEKKHLEEKIRLQREKYQEQKIRGNATPMNKMAAIIQSSESALEALETLSVKQKAAWLQFERVTHLVRPIGNLLPSPQLNAQTCTSMSTGATFEHKPNQNQDSDGVIVIEPPNGHENDFLCPYTLEPFKRPYSNKNCSHHIEETSLQQLLTRAAQPRIAKANKPSKQSSAPPGYFYCPVYGCFCLWGVETSTFDPLFLLKTRLFFERKTHIMSNARLVSDAIGIVPSLSHDTEVKGNEVIDLVESDCDTEIGSPTDISSKLKATDTTSDGTDDVNNLNNEYVKEVPRTSGTKRFRDPKT